jgi:membrane fusion protein (multidrug efflux system)
MTEVPEQNSNLPEKPSFFRREALTYHAGAQHEANLLELGPAWIRRSYWVLLAACTAALLYSLVGRINEYATGTAVIRSDDRIDINAHLGGTVEAVLVRPGQRVVVDQPLIRLYGALEAANLGRIESEFEQHLVSMLRNPNDAAARSAMAGLRAQREQVLAQIDERILRAPRAGVVSHLTVREGQQLQPGDLALSLTGGESGFRVLAVLPGQYRPLIRPGMRMRLELRGFPYAYQTVSIESISDEVVGPAEVRRYMPQSIADAFDPMGPMIFIEAALPGRSFTVSGRPLGYYDGMFARAEVVVRSESILLRFIPGLRTFLGDHGEGY